MTWYVVSASVVLIVCVSIVLNLVLPAIMVNFATPAQIKPPTGASNLNFWDQIMHMLVHHHQVPIASSLVVALIVLLSILGGKFLTKFVSKPSFGY